jgi:hypothetical protein
MFYSRCNTTAQFELLHHQILDTKKALKAIADGLLLMARETGLIIPNFIHCIHKIGNPFIAIWFDVVASLPVKPIFIPNLALSRIQIPITIPQLTKKAAQKGDFFI